MSISFVKNVYAGCHVNKNKTERDFSDRFLNPNNMVCPPRAGVDTLGRPAGEYSIRTTSAGCNSALERVAVEDYQRPSAFSSVSLNNIGMMGGYTCSELERQELASQQAQQIQRSYGSISNDSRAYYSQKMRDQQMYNIGERVNYYKSLSGF